jgi:hypothetical protein
MKYGKNMTVNFASADAPNLNYEQTCLLLPFRVNYSFDKGKYTRRFESFKAIEEWCYEMFEQDFYLTLISVRCKSQSDATLFKLTWC